MRLNFDIDVKNTDKNSSSAPKEKVEWVPLHSHPILSAGDVGATYSTTSHTLRNLLTWDGASRLYFWDYNKQCLHRISLRLGEPEPTSVLAASPSKVLQPDVKLDFEVNEISLNRNGSALLLAGSNGLCIMYLYGRTSEKDITSMCRTVSVGSQIYFSNNSVIRTLKVAWHPYSDTHLGILSSDSVFRLYDLSSNLGEPEQEYYLQPVELGKIPNAASFCAVGSSFGGDHLWDRFSVFILFSDGSIYILCPVVPFGSVYLWKSILEMYNDAHTFGLKSANPIAVSNSALAISWLEGTFPDLTNQAAKNSPSLRAHPYALFDASLSLQGPLRKVCHIEEEKEIQGPQCEGRAVNFLYNTISKDLILIIAWSGGQLQIDALADEIQPLWNTNSPPRLRFDSNSNHANGLAMICEAISSDFPIVKFDNPLDDPIIWLGHPPPLLRLAIVDLALPKNSENGCLISMFVDPLMPEKIYTIHDGGIDSIVLHFLPFTSQTSGKNEPMTTPSVHPILSTCQGEKVFSSSPLCGYAALSDSFGYSWIVGITSSGNCTVLEMKTWNLLLAPLHADTVIKEEILERVMPDIISKELLCGPKVVLLPQSSPHMRSIYADSIEGRSTLHQYFKLFHENYVEYAHKVYFELKHHGPHLKKIIDDQQARLREAQKKLLKIQEKQPKLDDRIGHAVQTHSLLEQRLQNLRNLPGAHKKPLSRAERDFKLELDRFRGVELDALHSSIEALNARLKKFTQFSQRNVPNQQRQISLRKNYAQDAQILHLQSSLERLSLTNSENSEKIKLIEAALRSKVNQ